MKNLLTKKMFYVMLTLCMFACIIMNVSDSLADSKNDNKNIVLTPEIISVNNNSSAKITVRWNKVVDCSGYQISYSNGKTTKTVKISSAKTVSKIISGFKKGEQITVKIRAYKKTSTKTYYSRWSTAKKIFITKSGSAVTLSKRKTTDQIEAPYLPSILSINDNGIQVYWRQPEVSDGYEVFRSYKKNGSYYYIGDCHEWSYFDTSFDESKKTVYYRVCNYVYDKSGNRIYSKFTDVLTANYRDELTLSRKTTYLPSGSERPLEALYGWGNAKGIVWSSTDTSIATVDSNGMVHARKKGICYISAYSAKLKVAKYTMLVVDRETPQMLGNPAEDFKKDANNVWQQTSKADKDKDSALIMLVGDLMCMGNYQNKFRTSEKTYGLLADTYNFNECYTYVRDLLSSADYTFGNLETVLDSAMPYSCDMGRYHYRPTCNAPATFLDALVNAGFDGVALANNHSADGDIHGVTETLAQCDKYNLGRTGMQSGTDDNDRYLLTEVNGIKVGYLSYCTSLNAQDAYWDIEDLETYQNRYEKKKATADVKKLRSLGAEYIIVYIHWGTKNNFVYNESQEKMAKELANMGVDYIVGSHPHVLQKYEEIIADNGKVVPCIYSLGDFNSDINQIEGNRDTIILRIRLERAKDGSIKLTENNYIPCYIYTSIGDTRYVTVPLNYKLTELTGLYKYNYYRNRIAKTIGDGLTEYQPY